MPLTRPLTRSPVVGDILLEVFTFQSKHNHDMSGVQFLIESYIGPGKCYVHYYAGLTPTGIFHVYLAGYERGFPTATYPWSPVCQSELRLAALSASHLWATRLICGTVDTEDTYALRAFCKQFMKAHPEFIQRGLDKVALELL